MRFYAIRFTRKDGLDYKGISHAFARHGFATKEYGFYTGGNPVDAVLAVQAAGDLLAEVHDLELLRVEERCDLREVRSGKRAAPMVLVR